MARRGLQAYAVPSAQAGQRPEPSARRDSLSRIITALFLVFVVISAVTIVVATPEFAEPAVGGSEVLEAAAISPSPSPVITRPQTPSSRPPGRLKGYRWPLRGGTIVKYYDRDKQGYLTIAGERVHPGLALSWFKGAWVKAAHKGTVVAAGPDWAAQVGFEDPMDEVIDELRRTKKGRRRLGFGVVIDDGNGYHSVITGLKEIRVKVDDRVKTGTAIGRMAATCCIRYELVRMDGAWMRVADPLVERDRYPLYARERADPLLVFNPRAGKRPVEGKSGPPDDPPRITGD